MDEPPEAPAKAKWTPREPDPEEAKHFSTARARMGLSQRQFAEKLATTSNHISRIERTVRPPSAALLRRLAILEEQTNEVAARKAARAERRTAQQEPPAWSVDPVDDGEVVRAEPPAASFHCDCPDCEVTRGTLGPQHKTRHDREGPGPAYEDRWSGRVYLPDESGSVDPKIAKAAMRADAEVRAQARAAEMAATRPVPPVVGAWQLYRPGGWMASFRANLHGVQPAEPPGRPGRRFTVRFPG